MRKHSYLRALALAALLVAPLTETALAGESSQLAMAPAAAPASSVGITGPYDAATPTVGD